MQKLQFDIDIGKEQFEYIQDSELNISPQEFEKQIRQQFRIKDEIKCEIIDRSRPDKISYHIRFNANMKESVIHTLIESGNQFQLFEFMDLNIYATQLRITTHSSDMLFNPLDFEYSP